MAKKHVSKKTNKINSILKTRAVKRLIMVEVEICGPEAVGRGDVNYRDHNESLQPVTLLRFTEFSLSRPPSTHFIFSPFQNKKHFIFHYYRTKNTFIFFADHFQITLLCNHHLHHCHHCPPPSPPPPPHPLTAP